jgi:hypothetical protein
MDIIIAGREQITEQETNTTATQKKSEAPRRKTHYSENLSVACTETGPCTLDQLVIVHPMILPAAAAFAMCMVMRLLDAKYVK